MSTELVARRTQYSSCDDCRKSRVACDGVRDGPSCTRCVNRQRPCTFLWVKNAKPKSRRKTQSRKIDCRKATSTQSDDDVASSADTSFTDSTARNGLLSPPDAGRLSIHGLSASDATGPTDAQWLPVIYRESWEAIFGSWMGRYSCPFTFVAGENALGEVSVSISDLCHQLDLWMAEETAAAQTSHVQNGAIPDLDREQQISDSLHSTIAAFSARWLPVISTAELDSLGLIQKLWRYARRNMLKVINRPTYRSMLTLFLYALTPIPAGISEDEELDGISGQACLQVALQQIQTLRARQKNLQFNGAKVSPSTRTDSVSVSPSSIGAAKFIHAESIAYWAALTFDTSASLTLNCKSLLSSGLLGVEAEVPWRLVRTCSKMFSEVAEHWPASSYLGVTDEKANQVIAAGAAWKLLAWKLTAVFKEALREGHDESEVSRAYTAVVDSIQLFNSTYRPHMESCQRRMQFLHQQTKLRWYSLMLHYHLSILLFVDVIEATDRHDLLVPLAEVIAGTEATVLNTLVFGLHNNFTLAMKPDPVIGPDSTDSMVKVSLIAIDPYPHHVVAAVRLIRKGIDRDFYQSKISLDAYDSLQSTLKTTVDHLPQSSKSVQAASGLTSYNTMNGTF